MKIVSVVGARPNFVKLAAVDGLFRARFTHVVVHTGQHYDYEMSRIFFSQLSIPEPDYHLGIGSGSHGYQVGETIKLCEEVLLKERPDLVVVYGDVNSTLAGALAAVKAGFKVAHVEAGLRSFDVSMPEEVNRRVVDHISHLLFAPTVNAVETLKRENVMGKIFLTGDVHVDVLAKWAGIAEENSRILESLGLKDDEYIVATIHRVENAENMDRLKNILLLLKELTKEYKIVFPIHPRTRKKIAEFNYEYLTRNGNLLMTSPLGYLDFIKLVAHSRMVLTDSGGVQREAYLLRRPVVVLRNRTEWIELVEQGWALLMNPESVLVADMILEFEPKNYPIGLLGDGKAGKKIVKIIENFLSN